MFKRKPTRRGPKGNAREMGPTREPERGRDIVAPGAPAQEAECGRAWGTIKRGQSKAMTALLQPATREWIIGQLRGAQGHAGTMVERSFCQAEFLHHFNSQRGAATAADFTRIGDTAVAQRVDAAVEALGTAMLAKIRRATGELGWAGRGRPSGYQFSWGYSRAQHWDQPHLGDLIITVTLEGSCHIAVQRPRSEKGRGRIGRRSGAGGRGGRPHKI